MLRAHCARAWTSRGRQAAVGSTAASAIQVPAGDKVGLRLQTWRGRQPRRGDVDVNVDGDGDADVDVDGHGASNSCRAGAKRVDAGQAGAAGHGRGRLTCRRGRGRRQRAGGRETQRAARGGLGVPVACTRTAGRWMRRCDMV